MTCQWRVMALGICLAGVMAAVRSESRRLTHVFVIMRITPGQPMRAA